MRGIISDKIMVIMCMGIEKCVSPREDRGQLWLWPEIHATSRVFGTLGVTRGTREITGVCSNAFHNTRVSSLSVPSNLQFTLSYCCDEHV